VNYSQNSQICPQAAQICPLITADPRGKSKDIMFIKNIRECFHSLRSFKHSKNGVRSVLENLTHSLNEEKKQPKQLVLWRSISPVANRFPLGPCINPLTEGGRDSTLKEKFLSRLKECDGYPFNEYEDGAFFHRVYEEYPGIDIFAELDKKLKWWKDHPKALRQANKIPRAQLDEFFENEFKFQQKRKFG
jgi:hypothetical protein